MSARWDDPHLDPFVARVYDAEHAAPEDDVPWVLDLASRGGAVADLGCGTGRLTLPLAQAGYMVEALDHSAAMLERLQHKLSQQSPAVQQRVHLHHVDLSAIGSVLLSGSVSLAMIGYNTFGGLLTAGEQQECLRQVHATLRPGGQVAIATAVLSAASLGLPEGLSREVYRRPAPELGEGVTLARRDVHRWTDETNQVRHLALVYDVLEPDGGRQLRQFEYVVRYSSRWELEHLLVRCGFSSVQVLGGYASEPFDVAGGLLVVTAGR